MIDFNSVEFYVIAGAIAAAVIAVAALPARRGPAEQRLIGGMLEFDDTPAEPSIDINVDDNRRVIITRHGLTALTDRGAASLAVEIAGFNITIEERLTTGNGLGQPATATFILGTLAPERYHIRYNSQATSTFAAFTLPVREGIHVHRDLR